MARNVSPAFACVHTHSGTGCLAGERASRAPWNAQFQLLLPGLSRTPHDRLQTLGRKPCDSRDLGSFLLASSKHMASQRRAAVGDTKNEPGFGAEGQAPEVTTILFVTGNNHGRSAGCSDRSRLAQAETRSVAASKQRSRRAASGTGKGFPTRNSRMKLRREEWEPWHGRAHSCTEQTLMEMYSMPDAALGSGGFTANMEPTFPLTRDINVGT